GAPVDPYDPTVDVTAATDVVVDGVLDFNGVSNGGLPLDVLADVALTSVTNQVGTAVVDLAGNVVLDLDGFVTDIDVSNITATLDMVQGQATDVVGQVQGTVDLPARVFDATFDVSGVGATIDVAVQAAASFFGFGIFL
ncbi:MAG: hypothetical protein ACE5JG_09955, partial [Planctomycetota bacterium]